MTNEKTQTRKTGYSVTVEAPVEQYTCGEDQSFLERYSLNNGDYVALARRIEEVAIRQAKGEHIDTSKENLAELARSANLLGLSKTDLEGIVKEYLADREKVQTQQTSSTLNLTIAQRASELEKAVLGFYDSIPEGYDVKTRTEYQKVIRKELIGELRRKIPKYKGIETDETPKTKIEIGSIVKYRGDLCKVTGERFPGDPTIFNLDNLSSPGISHSEVNVSEMEIQTKNDGPFQLMILYTTKKIRRHGRDYLFVDVDLEAEGETTRLFALKLEHSKNFFKQIKNKLEFNLGGKFDNLTPEQFVIQIGNMTDKDNDHPLREVGVFAYNNLLESLRRDESEIIDKLNGEIK